MSRRNSASCKVHPRIPQTQLQTAKSPPFQAALCEGWAGLNLPQQPMPGILQDPGPALYAVWPDMERVDGRVLPSLSYHGVFCGRTENRLSPLPSDLSGHGAILRKWGKRGQTGAGISSLFAWGTTPILGGRGNASPNIPTSLGLNESLSRPPSPHVSSCAPKGPNGPFLICIIKKNIISRVR